MLAGEDAGPAKMAKAEELGIKILNEDEFLKLIENSNKKIKHESSNNGKDKNHDKKSHRNKHVNGSSSMDKDKKNEMKKEKIDSEFDVAKKIEKKKIKLEVIDKSEEINHDTKVNGVVKLEEDFKSESVSSTSSSINLANSEFGFFNIIGILNRT